MQSFIRKVKSMPLLRKKEDHFLSPSEFLAQIAQLDELIDTMIADFDNDQVLVFSSNKNPARGHYLPNFHYLDTAEDLRQRLPRARE
jgi:hypothetical protein